MSSGGNSDDVGPEFYATIARHIAALKEEIADLAAVAHDDPYRASATWVIEEKDRAIRHLRGFLLATSQLQATQIERTRPPIQSADQ